MSAWLVLLLCSMSMWIGLEWGAYTWRRNLSKAVYDAFLAGHQFAIETKWKKYEQS